MNSAASLLDVILTLTTVNCIYLVVVIVFIQTSTSLNRNTAFSLEHKTWFAEAATDTGASAVGGGFFTAGNARWTTLYVLSIRRTLHY